MNTSARSVAPIAAALAALLLSGCAGILPGLHTSPQRPAPSTPQIEGAGTVWECRHSGQSQCQSRPYRP